MKTSLWRSICMSCLMLVFIVPLSHARETDRGTVIYEQSSLLVTVYGWAERPRRKLTDFCSGKKRMNPNSYSVRVTYDVPHRERTKLITPSYEGFVRDKVYPSLIKTCGAIDITEIVMSMSKTGEYTRQDWRDTMTFAVADNGKTVTQTNYHPNSIAKANMSMEEIAALMPSQTSSAPSSSQKRGKELFNDGKVMIYAREDTWCTSKDLKRHPTPTAGLDIIVPVSYNELQGWLRKHYGRFELSVIKPLAEKSCFPGGGFNAKFYQQGQADYLEDVRYGWEKSRSTMQREQFAVKSRHTGQTRDARLAVIQKEKERQDAWGIPCKGYFCALPGGAYFQAILAGDINAVKHMDAMADAHVKEWVRKKLGSSIANRKKQHYSLLPVIADTYFFNYQSDFMLGCHEGGLVTKSYSFTDDMYETPDFGDLAMPDMGGETVTTTYVLRPEFVQLCDKVCDAFGGKFDRSFIKTTNMSAARETLNSVYEMPELYQCSSDAVRLFEKNLIKLTETYLKNKQSWLNTSSAQVMHNQVKPKAVKNPPTQPVQNTKRERLTPSIQPSSTNASAAHSENSLPETVQTQAASTAPAQSKRETRMREAERYERMNAEISVLSEIYTARLNDLSQEFKKNMVNVSDSARRTEMLTEFQAKMAELSAEAARETQKVKDKYKDM